MTACLVADNVSRVFGGLKAVDGVSLAVGAGERRAVIGPNGAGKTTLFNLVSGDIPVSAGSIWLFGEDATRRTPYQRAGLGMARTFQITRLFANLTVRENLLIACAALDATKFTMHRALTACAPIVARARELLAAFALEPLAGQLARHLSYGDQRKLEVALSLAGRPRLLLLDEPMAGLSGRERDAMRQLIENLDPAMAVLLIEHDMDIAFAIAETVTVLYQGRVLADGPAREVAADPRVQEVYLGVPVGS